MEYETKGEDTAHLAPNVHEDVCSYIYLQNWNLSTRRKAPGALRGDTKETIRDNAPRKFVLTKLGCVFSLGVYRIRLLGSAELNIINDGGWDST